MRSKRAVKVRPKAVAVEQKQTLAQQNKQNEQAVQTNTSDTNIPAFMGTLTLTDVFGVNMAVNLSARQLKAVMFALGIGVKYNATHDGYDLYCLDGSYAEATANVVEVALGKVLEQLPLCQVVSANAEFPYHEGEN